MMIKLKPYRIGFRTIKTAVGMALGIIIAKLIGLENFSSAAILVVLCIKSTKIKSLQAAWSRLFSCLLGILFSYIFFMNLGFSPVVLGLLVLLFIPVTVMFGAQEGVVTSCVIILHCFNSGHIDMKLVINEVLLIMIGLGIALLMNAIMPNHDKKLHQYRKEIETGFQMIIMNLSQGIKHPEKELGKDDIHKLETTLRKAKSIAFTEVENHFSRNENSFYHYFDMREEQLSLLSRMVDLINAISYNDKIHNKCSTLLDEMAKNVSCVDYTAIRLHDLYALQLEMDDYKLPQTMEEMKSRAACLQLTKEIEQYLLIKSKFGSLKLYR